MRILFTNTALVLLSVVTLLSSCSKHQRSEKTGIPYNDKNNGGYVKFRQTHPSPGPGLVAIEGGTFVLGGSADQDVTYDYNNIRRRVTVPSFYMDETEVSNQDWIDYLHWISTTFPQDYELYYNALPDTLVWRRPLSYNEPYVDNYLRHPAFQDYPVVGVSWDQAQDYCQWRTDRVNEHILQEKGLLATPKDNAKKGKNGASTAVAATTVGAFNTEIYLNGQYKGPGIDGRRMIPDLNGQPQTGTTGKAGKAVRPARMEDGILKPAYRLPSEAEWEYAALALAGNTQFENISNGKVYPWNGLGVRSPKKKTRGLILANFKRGEGDNAGVGGYLNDKADITAPVRSYEPNDFGLYNMAGNVNEWVEDTYRQTSFEEADDFNPFRGNQYVNNHYSDPSKGMLAKDKYGRPVTEAAKTGTKTPYPLLNKPAVGKPYNADLRGYGDSVNTTLYGTTTLVNDHSKVYKGGSWNDLAYWLNPSTRRFMDEDQSSAEVGFRCAMTLVGAPEISPSGKSHFSVKKSKY
jgi:sulfatase modifying factor 1